MSFKPLTERPHLISGWGWKHIRHSKFESDSTSTSNGAQSVGSIWTCLECILRHLCLWRPVSQWQNDMTVVSHQVQISLVISLALHGFTMPSEHMSACSLMMMTLHSWWCPGEQCFYSLTSSKDLNAHCDKMKGSGFEVIEGLRSHMLRQRRACWRSGGIAVYDEPHTRSDCSSCCWQVKRWRLPLCGTGAVVMVMPGYVTAFFLHNMIVTGCSVVWFLLSAKVVQWRNLGSCRLRFDVCLLFYTDWILELGDCQRRVFPQHVRISSMSCRSCEFCAPLLSFHRPIQSCLIMTSHCWWLAVHASFVTSVFCLTNSLSECCFWYQHMSCKIVWNRP